MSDLLSIVNQPEVVVYVNNLTGQEARFEGTGGFVNLLILRILETSDTLMVSQSELLRDWTRRE